MNKPPVDPKIAAVLSSVFAILGVFGVFAMLDLSADQVAILTGSAGTLATMLRAYLLGRAHRAANGKPKDEPKPDEPKPEDEPKSDDDEPADDEADDEPAADPPPGTSGR